MMQHHHQQRQQRLGEVEEAECETIRLLILTERAAREQFRYSSLEDLMDHRNYLWRTEAGHECRQDDCDPVSFKRDQPFKHPRTKRTYQTTGTVYVCHTSGISHVCTADRCRKQYQTAHGEYCCRMSGITYGAVLGVNPYQDTRKSWDTGNEEGVQAEEDSGEAGMNEELFQGVHTVLMDKNEYWHDQDDVAPPGGSDGDAEINDFGVIVGDTPEKARRAREQVEQRLEADRQQRREREVDRKINHLLLRHRPGCVQNSSGLLSDSYNYRAVEKIVRALLFGDTKESTGRQKRDAALATGDRAVKKYLRDCVQGREMAVEYWCHLAFLDTTKDYVHQDAQQYRADIVQYYVLLVLKLWSIVLTTRYARANVSLFYIRNHALATLYMLQEGMVVKKFGAVFELIPRDLYMIARLPVITQIRSYHIDSRTLTKGTKVIQQCLSGAVDEAETPEQLGTYELRANLEMRAWLDHD